MTTSMDVYAEQGLLAGIIDDPSLINEVAKNVSAQDFREPRHENIYQAILALHNKGMHVDLVTVGAELRDRGDLQKVGGPEYLSSLTDPGAPYAADADPISYSFIVADESKLRKLNSIGRDIVAMTRLDSGVRVDEAVARSETMVRELLNSTAGKQEASQVGDLIDDTMATLERRASIPGGTVQGVPTGFIDLDKHTTGFHPGNFIILAARPAVGKALALDTPVQTPAGPVAIGDIKVGDVIYAYDSSLTHVTGVTETMVDETCYEITYDGGNLIADANHEFPVLAWNKDGMFRIVVTVNQMNDLINSGHELAFPAATPVQQLDAQFDTEDVLRKAHAVFSGQQGPRANSLTRAVVFYLFDGKPTLNAGTREIAQELYEMAISVGLVLSFDGPLLTMTASPGRVIHSINQIDSVPVRCIEIAHESHLYLCNDWIISHNSTLALDFARAASLKADKSVLFFSLEMSKEEIMDRLFSAEANVGLQKIRSGTLSDSEWSALREVAERIKNASFFIDATPNVTIEYIRAKAAQQASTPEGLDMIVVDYLQLMRSAGKVESRQQEVSEFSRSMKLMAKEFGIPVIALSQLNRGPENRADKTPAPSDLRESGSLEQDADLVLLLHRPSTEAANADRTSLIIAKNRNGPTETVSLAPLLAYSKFANGTGMYPTDEPPEDYIPPGDLVDVPDPSFAAVGTGAVYEPDPSLGEGAAW